MAHISGGRSPASAPDRGPAPGPTTDPPAPARPPAASQAIGDRRAMPPLPVPARGYVDQGCGVWIAKRKNTRAVCIRTAKALCALSRHLFGRGTFASQMKSYYTERHIVDLDCFAQLLQSQPNFFWVYSAKALHAAKHLNQMSEFDGVPAWLSENRFSTNDRCPFTMAVGSIPSLSA